MIKILIAGADVNNNQNFCRFFIYDKKFFVYNALTVNDVLDKYSTMEPNILIIGTSLGVSNCINIINKISSLSNISNKCYTIIVATLDETNNIIFKLKNLSIIYKILDKPMDKNRMINVINEITSVLTLNELTSDDVKSILLMLNISVSSKGANYLIASIILCYYCPFLLENLENDVYKRVADYYDTTKDKVRENIRNALLNVDNSYIDKFSSPLFKLLDYKDNITPKKFIEIMATYFRNRNKK